MSLKPEHKPSFRLPAVRRRIVRVFRTGPLTVLGAQRHTNGAPPVLTSRKHQVAQCRNRRHRDNERCAYGGDVGHAERAEDTPGQIPQEEYRYENQHDDQRRVHDGVGDLPNRVEHYLQGALRRCRGTVEPQAAHDVLDRDDAVVHHLADRDRKASQRHGVDTDAERVHYQDSANK